MYHKVPIQKLSHSQILKLLRGERIRVKSGSGHELHLSHEQAKKVMSAHKKGKGCCIILDPFQQKMDEHLHLNTKKHHAHHVHHEHEHHAHHAHHEHEHHAHHEHHEHHEGDGILNFLEGGFLDGSGAHKKEAPKKRGRPRKHGAGVEHKYNMTQWGPWGTYDPETKRKYTKEEIKMNKIREILDGEGAHKNRGRPRKGKGAVDVITPILGALPSSLFKGIPNPANPLPTNPVGKPSKPPTNMMEGGPKPNPSNYSPEQQNLINKMRPKPMPSIFRGKGAIKISTPPYSKPTNPVFDGLPSNYHPTEYNKMPPPPPKPVRLSAPFTPVNPFGPNLPPMPKKLGKGKKAPKKTLKKAHAPSSGGALYPGGYDGRDYKDGEGHKHHKKK